MKPFFSLRPATAFLIVVASSVLAGCGSSGSVIRLSYEIKRQAESLGEAPVGTIRTFDFAPTRSADRPFSVVLFPNRTTTVEELVAAGVPGETAERMFQDLGYVDVGDGGMLVIIEPEKRFEFTGHWNHWARVDDLIVVTPEGPQKFATTFEVMRTADGVVVSTARTTDDVGPRKRRL